MCIRDRFQSVATFVSALLPTTVIVAGDFNHDDNLDLSVMAVKEVSVFQITRASVFVIANYEVPLQVLVLLLVALVAFLFYFLGGCRACCLSDHLRYMERKAYLYCARSDGHAKMLAARASSRAASEKQVV